MLTWPDCLAARSLLALGLMTEPEVRAAFKALPKGVLLLDKLVEGGRLDEATRAKVDATSRRFDFLRAEAIYVRQARSEGVEAEVLVAAKSAQEAENFARRVGDWLVDEGHLDAERHGGILESARLGYDEDTERLLGFARERFLEGSERRRSTGRILNIQKRGELEEFYGSESDATTAETPIAGPSAGLPEPQPLPETPSLPEAGPLPESSPLPETPPLPESSPLPEPSPLPEAPPLPESSPLPSAPLPVPPIPRAPGGWGTGSSAEKPLAPSGSSSSADELSPGTVIEGRYTVMEQLGRGGMGAVYRARRADVGESDDPAEDLALKVALPDPRGKDKDVLKRFKREILVTSMVDHPNIVQVHDAGPLPDGSFFLVMELVPGRELSELLRESGVLEPTLALGLTRQLLEGLRSCHESDVIHRDVKPENLRVNGEPPDLKLKLMDFGLSRLLTEEVAIKSQIYATQATTVTGSPAYMSPESFIDASNVDHRCDLYSVGVSLFEMLTGRLPFKARSPTEYLKHHHYSAVPSMQELMPEGSWNRELETFVRKLMEKDKELRIQTAAEALERLAALESGGEDEASSTGARVRKRKRRTPDAASPGFFGRIKRLFGLGG